MDERYHLISIIASTQHGAVSHDQMNASGIDRYVRRRWVKRGLIIASGPRSYVIAGSASSWERSLWTASADVGKSGYIAGRAAARLLGLDGFVDDVVELLVPREHRSLRTPHVVRSTTFPLERSDSVTVDGIRCLTAERLILDSPLFGFTRHETENAIDSAIRQRLVSEQRLRTRVIARHRRSINGGRMLLDALIDSGGESRLERLFLRIVRAAGLPRPEL
ncbi:MAG TPA: hypothetical protein VGM78_08970, partial [Ilumatobacteraceae bacterium]